MGTPFDLGTSVLYFIAFGVILAVIAIIRDAA
jgi:hypothetical protein